MVPQLRLHALLGEDSIELKYDKGRQFYLLGPFFLGNNLLFLYSLVLIYQSIILKIQNMCKVLVKR